VIKLNLTKCHGLSHLTIIIVFSQNIAAKYWSNHLGGVKSNNIVR